MSPRDASVSRFRVHPDVIKLGAVSPVPDARQAAREGRHMTDRSRTR
jgi:hypothetical protein